MDRLGILEKFQKIEDENTIARLFTSSDDDLMEFMRDAVAAHREPIFRAFQTRLESMGSDWDTIYKNVHGFLLKLKSKRKADFSIVGVKRNQKNGVLYPLSKAGSTVYEDVKEGGNNIEQIYIELREAVTIIRTARSWVCIYQTTNRENYARILNRDKYPKLTIVDLILETRTQPGIKNYGFTE